MSFTPRTPVPAVRRRLAALGVAGALVLAACGGDDDAESMSDIPDEVQDAIDQVEDLDVDAAASEGDVDGDVGDGGGAIELIPPQFPLPSAIEAPAGFQALPARCEPPEGEGTWITYAVPEDWENTSRGTGGSGSALSNSTELGFVRPDGGDVSVGVDPESRQPDGTVLDWEGKPWESFDYEITAYGDDGETTTQVTYASAGTVPVGDQQVEIWVADQSQAPDDLGTTEAKARVESAELPNPAPGDEDKVWPQSFVITIEWDADDGEVAPETVKTIVGSLAMPTCTQDSIVVGEEIKYGEDLDGDGEVATIDDMLS